LEEDEDDDKILINPTTTSKHKKYDRHCNSY